MPLALELTASTSPTAKGRRCSRTSTCASSRASSSRSPARTVAARRRCCGSRSASSGRRAGRCSLYGEPARSFRDRTSIGYLAQRTKIGLHAPATVRDVVEAGRAPLRPYGRLAPGRPRGGRPGARARRPARAGAAAPDALCPEGSNSARSSRRRSRRIRACSCWTSRPPASTSKRRTRWARCFIDCTRTSA